MGMKYHRLNYVIIDWQDNDMPQFGRIDDIMVVEDTAYLRIISTETLGVDHHYHSFVINCRPKGDLVLLLTELVDYQVYEAHFLNSCVYLNFRSHVEK